MKHLTFQLGILFLLSACQAGSGEFLEVSESPINNPSTDSSNLLSQIQQQIFSPICTECHTGSQAPLGLRLESADLAYQFLVNVDAIGDPSFKRVSPSAADNSFIYLKITGDVRAGSRMPLGRPSLSTTQINLIRDWINQGALPEANNQTLLHLSSVEKLKRSEDQSNILSDTRYVVKFSRPFDSASITKESLQLSEDYFGERQAISTDLFQLTIINSYSVELLVSSVLQGKNIILSLNNNTGNSVLDTLGRMIDADHNNEEGGEYEIHL